MKNFSKLAIIGAVLAASAQFASATTFTGTNVTLNGSVAMDAGSTATTFTLSSIGGVTFSTGGTPNLGTYTTNPTLYTFTASGGVITTSGSTAGATPGELFSASNGTGTVAFIGQTYSAFTKDPSNDYTFIVSGYFTDGTAAPVTFGSDNFTFNAGSGSGSTAVTESFSVAPEPNSLILLGTGLVSAAGAFMRKRVIA